MATRIGQHTIALSSRPTVLTSAAVAGKKEGEGPLGKHFDAVFEDTRMGEDSWEKAESALQKEAFNHALKKAALTSSQIQTLFAGDLLNQCTASAFGLRESGVPLLGQYGACSTMAQTLAVASLFVDSGAADLCAAVTSSHFCSAERQFRFPLTYGGQRTPTAQWTATAAGCALVGTSGNVHVREITVGRVVDLGITDANNMGAAMAPADGILTPYESEKHSRKLSRGTQSFKNPRHRKDAIPDNCYIPSSHPRHPERSHDEIHSTSRVMRAPLSMTRRGAVERVSDGMLITHILHQSSSSSSHLLRGKDDSLSIIADIESPS